LKLCKTIAVAGIVFSGDENKATEEIILSKTGIKMKNRTRTLF
jgi:dethiobiotin synthetase